MDNNKFLNLAVQQVVDYTNDEVLPSNYEPIDNSQVFIVWSAKILGNNKAMLGTRLDKDFNYYEVTYDGEKKLFYLDVYSFERQVVSKSENYD